MFTGFLKKGILFTFVLIACATIISAQVKNDIYFKYCEVHPQMQCFNPVAGAVDSVGRDVSQLGGGFTFCLKIDTLSSGFAPVRVVLVLDNSLSMCQNPGGGAGGTGGCCVVGDSSGECMNNDPDDKRVEAAHVFVDSLRALNPQSEVGVVVFSGEATGYGVLSLETEENVKQIHSWIANAGCQGGAGKPGLGTNLGRGLQTGLSLADTKFDELNALMMRHIILLTDGAWDDVATRSPKMILDTYAASYPERDQPTIHGVFISDSLTHVQHGYPWQGCAGNGQVDLSNLEYAADSTGGLYFPGSRPETVIENFQMLLDSVVQRAPQSLQGMVVTNLTNGEVRTQKTISKVDGTSIDSVTYYASIDNLPLVMGLNTLKIQNVVKKSEAGSNDTITSVVKIFRTDKWTTEINQAEYELYCVNDSTTISIIVSPEQQPVNVPFDVKSTITLKDEFVIDTIEVQVLTQFPDDGPGTVGVYHLEKNLKNSTDATDAVGTGLEYTSTSELFGNYSMKQGSFGVSLSNLSADFALEAWVFLPANVKQASLISGNGFTLGIGADRLLYFTADGIETVKAYMPLDDNSWVHVAVSRASGKITLFVNGMSASATVPFATTLIGTATINCPAGGMLDEVRISNVNRQKLEAGRVWLDIPSLQKPLWTVAGTSSTKPMLLLLPEMWKAGTMNFEFASSVNGKLLVNFRHEGTTETQWSKNGNPVFAAGDLGGPYVERAVFTTGVLGGIHDTLKVFFNEPVRCDSLKKNADPGASLKIYNQNGVPKDTVFRGANYLDATCPTPFIREVTIITRASVDGIVPRRDVIQLIGSVVDSAGNYPDTSKRGPIEYGGDNDFVIVSYENEGGVPMELSSGIASRIGATAGTIGKAIVIQTTRPLTRKPEMVTPDGRATWATRTMIYDPVANVVAADLPLIQFPNNDRLYYLLWNGTNRMKRRIASGAYLFKASVILKGDERERHLGTKLNIQWSNGK